MLRQNILQHLKTVPGTEVETNEIKFEGKWLNQKVGYTQLPRLWCLVSCTPKREEGRQKCQNNYLLDILKQKREAIGRQCLVNPQSWKHSWGQAIWLIRHEIMGMWFIYLHVDIWGYFKYCRMSYLASIWHSRRGVSHKCCVIPVSTMHMSQICYSKIGNRRPCFSNKILSCACTSNFPEHLETPPCKLSPK